MLTQCSDPKKQQGVRKLQGYKKRDVLKEMGKSNEMMDEQRQEGNNTVESSRKEVNSFAEEQMDEKKYAESLLPFDQDLDRVRSSILENQIHDISIAPAFGKLLTLLVRMTGAKEVLEIGALGGYSGICLARGMAAGGRLTSLEWKEENIRLARENLINAGFGGQVEYHAGEALESLKQLQAEGRKFDFFFIDADKGNYLNYLEWSIQLANPGAVIVGDNALMKGKVYQSKYAGHSVQTMRAFNEKMLNDKRLEGVLLPAYDGLSIARVK